jgi:hypothetical protein
MACFSDSRLFNSVAGLTGDIFSTSNCGLGPSVAGLAAGFNGSCIGPPFFVQRLAALRGIPVIICLDDHRCIRGEILQVCFDYIEFNCDGTLVTIPLKEITRVQLASSSSRAF